MRSTTQLYNTAISRLGGDQLPVNQSPQEGNTLGKLCDNLFPHVLDMTLSAHEWGFAVKRVRLAEHGKIEDPASAYGHAYVLPTDCVRPIRLMGDWFSSAYGGAVYVIEGNLLRTFEPNAVLDYVARVTDPQAWPAPFADALAWGLAAELASAHLNNAQKQNFCYQHYQASLAQAIARDCNNQNKPAPVSRWNAARHGMTSPRAERW